VKKKKPCRACTDFKSWSRSARKGNWVKEHKYHGTGTTDESLNNGNENTNQDISSPPDGCPLDKDSLGRQTWSYLHTMAAYYPDAPSSTEQKQMSAFMKIFSRFYPCDHCARDLREEIKECPPNTTSRIAFSLWMCQMHNIVNKKLGKPEFDCKLVDERWRDGWKTGECD